MAMSEGADRLKEENRMLGEEATAVVAAIDGDGEINKDGISTELGETVELDDTLLLSIIDGDVASPERKLSKVSNMVPLLTLSRMSKRILLEISEKVTLRILKRIPLLVLERMSERILLLMLERMSERMPLLEEMALRMSFEFKEHAGVGLIRVELNISFEDVGVVVGFVSWALHCFLIIHTQIHKIINLIIPKCFMLKRFEILNAISNNLFI